VSLCYIKSTAYSRYSHFSTSNPSAPAKQCVLIFALIQPHIVRVLSLTLYMVSCWVFCSFFGCLVVCTVYVMHIATCYVLESALALWPCNWTFTVQHTIYVKCEYFMNQEG